MRRAAIVAAARLWLGTPYLHQASLRGVGCDCLGLVRGVWREMLGDEPEMPPAYSPAWAESGGGETLLAAAGRHLSPVAGLDARPGDVLIFRWRPHLPAKHCAIVATTETILHAHDGAAVAEVAYSPWWRRHLAGAFAFPGVID